jgi:sulfite reductase alpha subunit-like flavoprotein
MMFPNKGRGRSFSLMPSPQLSQKQVGIMSWIIDVVKDGRAADFTGVVDDYIAKTQDALGN